MMNENIELLNQLYKNVRMGEETISVLIPSVQSAEMKGALEEQRNGYTDFCRKLREEIVSRHVEPKEFGIMTKMSADMGIKMNTMIDKTDSHIADMMIQGSTMGITEATKGMHDHQTAEKPVQKLAKDIVAFEQQNIEKMKAYL